MPSSRADAERGAGAAVTAVFLLGLALSLLLALRSEVGGDQLNLLARGWLLVARGEWVPYGNPASSGGATPGGVTALLVAAPLLLWRHHRAAVLGIVATQALAFLLLDRWLRAALSPRGRLLFAVAYWLSPWRAMLSGFLWNPGYLLLAGAVHAWSTWRQRDGARFVPSALHALALGIGFQVHPSAVLLGATSVLLLWSGHLRLRWSGVAAGGLLAAVPLVPWVLAVRTHPEMLPVREGFPGRGILEVTPFLRGVLLWVRTASLQLPDGELGTDFTPTFAPRLAAGARGLALGLQWVAGSLSALLALLALAWLWHGLRRRGRARQEAGGPLRARLARLGRRGATLLRARRGGRRWTAAYVRVAFVASLLVYAVAPTTVMWWQGVPLLHAAALPLALAAESAWRLPRAAAWRRRLLAGAWAWGSAACLVALLVAAGGRRFRCGGADCIVIALRHDHPMLHELHIAESCPIRVFPRAGWWPDVLPEPGDDAELPPRVIGR